MEAKISVVLPVYNVEKYLKTCIETVLNQTYKNLEIILVDDGSTDQCPLICDEFKEKDSRIEVIHKSNGGLSDARNAGTQYATGEYITFIDSDDMITSEYIEYLCYLIDKYKCDMSLCSHTVIHENGKKVVYGDGSDEVLSAKECLKRMLYHNVIDTSAWGKLYRTDVAKKILYPKGKLFEDIGTTYQFFIECGKIACGYKSQYFYMLRNNSIVTGRFNMHKFDLLDMTDRMAKDVCEKYPDLEKATLRRRVYARFSTLNQMLDVEGYESERQEIIDFIMKNGRVVMKDPLAPKRDKWAIRILKLGYPLYRKVWKLKCGK